MPKLPFIRDEDLEELVDELLLAGKQATKKAEKNFNANVIDPFAALFQMVSFDLSNPKWIEREKARQADKSLQNKIGNFHELVLSKVDGWVRPKKGVDLYSHDRKIIAEIKNKYNTVTGTRLTDVYSDLLKYVSSEKSPYMGYKAYLVQIIPADAKRYEVPFTPSDRHEKSKRLEHTLIWLIDGYSFYELVTGVDGALYRLFKVLPEVIRSSKHVQNLGSQQVDFLEDLFFKAYGKK